MNEKDIEEKAEQFEAALEGLMCAMEELRKDRDRLKKLAERPRGRWINRSLKVIYPAWERYTCSACGKHSYRYDFCPNCGAKMEG